MKLLADARSGAKVSEEDLVKALPLIATHLAATRHGIGQRGIQGGPDWMNVEIALWDLSEEIRGIMVRDKMSRGRTPLLDAVADIVRDPAYGKGRQNFVLMLGELGKGEYTAVLADLLDDDTVSGHAISALAKTRTPGFEKEAERLMEEAPTPNHRREAKKYLRRMASG